MRPLVRNRQKKGADEKQWRAMCGSLSVIACCGVALRAFGALAQRCAVLRAHTHTHTRRIGQAGSSSRSQVYGSSSSKKCTGE